MSSAVFKYMTDFEPVPMSSSLWSVSSERSVEFAAIVSAFEDNPLEYQVCNSLDLMPLKMF